MFDSKYEAQAALLIRCLPEIDRQRCFALKGGTAINFFVRNLPRLSVDIVLTYLAGRPKLADGFTRKTFTAMIEGVRQSAIEQGIIDPETFDRGIRDLYRTSEPDGTFCYTFFKATGRG